MSMIVVYTSSILLVKVVRSFILECSRYEHKRIYFLSLKELKKKKTFGNTIGESLDEKDNRKNSHGLCLLYENKNRKMATMT